MKLADGIRKHGFRKWYERELLQSHAHLVLTFLCAIGLFARVRGARPFRSVHDQLTNIVAIGMLRAAASACGRCAATCAC